MSEDRASGQPAGFVGRLANFFDGADEAPAKKFWGARRDAELLS
jgi:hypothetical protein